MDIFGFGDDGAQRMQQRANQAVQQGYNQGISTLQNAQGMYQPWMNAGTQALTGYQNMMQTPYSFDTTSPEYQYEAKMANQALAASGMNTQAPAIGQAFSPLIAQEANMQYQRRLDTMNQFNNLMGLGMNATNNYGNFGSAISNAQVNRGLAQGAGFQAYNTLGTQGWNNLINTGMSAFRLNQLGQMGM